MPARNIRQFAIARIVSNFGFYLMAFMIKVTGIIFSKLSCSEYAGALKIKLVVFGE